MAKLDQDLTMTVRATVVHVTRIVWIVCIAAVLIAGMHYGYECGCP